MNQNNANRQRSRSGPKSYKKPTSHARTLSGPPRRTVSKNSLLSNPILANTMDLEHCPEWVSEEDDRTQRYKLTIVRRLLAKFNLEDTMNYYRNLDSIPFRIRPSDYSIDCAMPATQARERLVQLTGSDQVQLNDARYMEHLKEKVWEEYEAEMERQEKERAEAERQRLRRLMMQGIISPEDMKEDSLLYKEYQKSQQGHKQRDKYKHKKEKKSAETSRREEAHSSCAIRKTACTPLDLKPSYSPPPRLRSSDQRSRVDSFCADSQMARLSDESEDDAPSGGPEEEDSNKQDKNIAEDSKESRTDTRETQIKDARGIKNEADIDNCLPRDRYEHPVVVQMRREQTVSGLYTLADQLFPTSVKTSSK